MTSHVAQYCWVGCRFADADAVLWSLIRIPAVLLPTSESAMESLPAQPPSQATTCLRAANEVSNAAADPQQTPATPLPSRLLAPAADRLSAGDAAPIAATASHLCLLYTYSLSTFKGRRQLWHWSCCWRLGSCSLHWGVRTRHWGSLFGSHCHPACPCRLRLLRRWLHFPPPRPQVSDFYDSPSLHTGAADGLPWRLTASLPPPPSPPPSCTLRGPGTLP
jgi:hypothetical protein